MKPISDDSDDDDVDGDNEGSGDDGEEGDGGGGDDGDDEGDGGHGDDNDMHQYELSQTLVWWAGCTNCIYFDF